LAGVEVHHQGRILVRRKWSGQEVPRAASASSIGGVHELQHRGAVVEMADLVALSRDHAPDRGHQAGGDGAAVGLAGRGPHRPAEGRLAGGLACLEPVHRGLMITSSVGQIAVLGVIGPR
jgi:hypothetical protein